MIKISFPLEQQQLLLDFPIKRLEGWLMKRQSQAILHLPDNAELIQKVFKNCVILMTSIRNCPIARKRTFYILESPLKSNWTTLLDKFNTSLDQNMILLHLLKTLVQELILKERDCKPFWMPVYKELSGKLLLPTEIDYVDSHLTSSNPSLIKQVEVSKYLTMTSIDVPKMNLQKICYPSSISSIVDKWEKEAIKQKPPKFKTIKIQIYPTTPQKLLIDECIDVHRYVYNRTLEYIKNYGYNPTFQNLRNILSTEDTKISYDINKYYSYHINKLKDEIKKCTQINHKNNLEAQLKYEQELLQDELKKLKPIKNPLILPFELRVSNEIRSNAIKSVCDAYKTGFTNLKNNNIKFFNMQFKKKSESHKCIELANSEINIINGLFKICPGKFKKECFIRMGKRNRIKYKNLKISNNCDLLKIQHKYFIHVSVPIKIPKTRNPIVFCGIDPGVRKFATVYSNGDNGIYEYNQSKMMKLIDKLNKKINLLKSLRRGDVKLYNMMYRKRKRARKRQITRAEDRKNNLVSDLHWRVIHDLISKNDLIFYGDIKSHDIVKTGKNKKLNRYFNDLKFYQFKQKLKYKALKHGKIVYLINEAYTSQGCSRCGNLKKDLKKAEIYDCNECHLRTGRDINASKNICMKGIITCM